MLESQRLYDEMLSLLNAGKIEEAKVPAMALKAILDDLEDEAWLGDLPHDELPQSKVEFKSVAVQHMFLTMTCHRVLRGLFGHGVQ